MRAVKNILCPLDLSPASARALQYAIPFARVSSAKLWVLEVVDFSLPPLPPGAYIAPTLTAEARAACLERLQRMIEPARAQGVDAEARLAEGRIVDGILAEAQAIAADLLVIGTHGRGGFEHLVLGSVTEKILRKAVCPVLAVPQVAAGADQPPPFQSILCPVDFSDVTAQTIAAAADLASAFNSRLTLMTVVEWPFGNGHVDEMPQPMRDLHRSLQDEARHELREAAAQAAPALPNAEQIVAVGKPSREILRVARERSAHLVVMGVYGRGAFDLAVLGSTAHRVIREGVCPVLTIRARKLP